MWVVSFVPCNRSCFQNFAEDDCWLFLCSLKIFCNFFQGLLVPLGGCNYNMIFKMACANVIRKVQDSDRCGHCVVACACFWWYVSVHTHALIAKVLAVVSGSSGLDPHGSRRRQRQNRKNTMFQNTSPSN